MKQHFAKVFVKLGAFLTNFSRFCVSPMGKKFGTLVSNMTKMKVFSLVKFDTVT